MRWVLLVPLLAFAACTSFSSEDETTDEPVDRDAAAADATVPPAPDGDTDAAAEPGTDWYQDDFERACSGWIVNRATMVWVDAGGRGGGGACLACFQSADGGGVNAVADKYVPTVDGGAVVTYEVDTWVKSVDGGSAGQARLIAFSRTADGGTRSNQANTIDVGRDWALLQVVTPAGPEPVTRVDLRLSSSSTCFYLDDVRVFPQR